MADGDSRVEVVAVTVAENVAPRWPISVPTVEISLLVAVSVMGISPGLAFRSGPDRIIAIGAVCPGEHHFVERGVAV